LHLLKLQLRDEIDKMRADFARRKTSASRGANLAGRGNFMVKKGTMSNMQLEDIRRQEIASLFPFEGVSRRIDPLRFPLTRVGSFQIGILCLGVLTALSSISVNVCREHKKMGIDFLLNLESSLRGLPVLFQ
jgi:hypothetical protein